MKELLGDNLYIFRQATRSQSIIISSHGGTLNTTFTVPQGLNLYYMDHENNAVASNLQDVMMSFDANAKPWNQNQEPAGTGGVPDSILTKFQGRHSRHHSKFRAFFQRCFGGYEESYSSIENSVGNFPYDVLTVRNRLGKHKRDILFSDVLQSLQQRHYTTVICLFCRGRVEVEYRDLFHGNLGLLQELENTF